MKLFYFLALLAVISEAGKAKKAAKKNNASSDVAIEDGDSAEIEESKKTGKWAKKQDKKKGKATLSKISHFNPNPMLKITAPDGSKYELTANRLFSVGKKKEPVEEPKTTKIKPKEKKQKGPDMDLKEAVLRGQDNKKAKSTTVNILKALDKKAVKSFLTAVLREEDEDYEDYFSDTKTFDAIIERMDEIEDEDTGNNFYEIFGEIIWKKARKMAKL